MIENNCVFCKILKGEIPSVKVFEDDKMLVFKDIEPKAKVHLLAVAKDHFKLLEEADEKTAAYLFVTPLGRKGYLAARFCLPAAAAFLVTAALLPVFGLSTRSLADILSLSAGGTLQGVIVALLIVTFSSNKLEGMAAAKLSSLLIFGAAVPFFLRQGTQYIMSPLPSFWIGKAIFEDTLVFMLPAFASSAVWIRFLLRRYLRKI